MDQLAEAWQRLRKAAENWCSAVAQGEETRLHTDRLVNQAQDALKEAAIEYAATVRERTHGTQ